LVACTDIRPTFSLSGATQVAPGSYQSELLPSVPATCGREVRGLMDAGLWEQREENGP